MIEYFVIALFTLCFSLAKFKNKKLQLFCCFFPWFVLIAGRVDWTADYPSYEFMFNERHDWSWLDYFLVSIKTKFEPAFFALIKYLPSYRWLIIVQSFCLLAALYGLFYKYIPARTYPLAFTLWMFNATFFESFAAMRSTFIVVLFIIAVMLKNKGRWLLAILVVFLSGFFHNSGWLLLPLICIPSDFAQKYFKIFVLGVIVTLVIALVSPSIYSSLLQNMMENSDSIDYSGYIQETSYGLGYYLSTIVRISIIVSLLCALKQNSLPVSYNYVVFIAILCCIMNSIPGLGLTYRMNCYLYPFLVVSLCCYYHYSQLNTKNNQFFYSKTLILLVVAEMFFVFSRFFEHPNYKICFEIYESAFF